MFSGGIHTTGGSSPQFSRLSSGILFTPVSPEDRAPSIQDDVKRVIVLQFLKERAGLKKNAANYATADFYEEHGLPTIAAWIRNK